MRTKPLSIAAIALAALAALLFVAWQFALRELKAQVRSALGPSATIQAIDVGLSAVVVHGLEVRAESPWPSEHQLRAQRVRIVPDLASVIGALFGDQAWKLDRIEVHGGYVSVLRTREGALRVLPGLLERPAPPKPGRSGATTALRIDQIVLDGAVDFYDASVRRPAHHLRLEALRATIGPLELPRLDKPVKLSIQASLQGRTPGRLSIEGQVTPSTCDARLTASAKGVDLLLLAPYIVKASDVAVRSGTLDLSLQASVEQQRLRAPGVLVLHGLELGSGGAGTALGTFAGVPASLVLAAISRDGQLDVPFRLQGRIDDPGFSLNADFGSKLALGLAEKLGVSVGGVVQGIADGLKGLFKK